MNTKDDASDFFFNTTIGFCKFVAGLHEEIGHVGTLEAESRDGVATDIYNVEAAEILANEAQLLPISDAVPIYEQLVSTFPTAAKFWKQYVEAYMAIKNDEATKQIFSRCLFNCPQISLWRCYIRFIRKINEQKGAEGLEETKKAFEFMLSYVGFDISAGPAWMEYITFLKSLPAVTAQEESQRMTSLRKVYQKAIVTPTHHIEQLWKEYENFENSINRALAKGLLSEYQPKYNSARAVYRERKRYLDEIDWNMLAVPPNDIWYDYATWHAKSGSLDSAIKAFQRALKALPDYAPLKYAYAELEESRGAIQSAKTIYESIVQDNADVISLAYIQFMKFLRRTEGFEAARKYFLDAQKLSNCTYHVFVAYAMMAFCLDKDVKVAHNVFEAGLKKFMNEPGYILEYADFLCRLNDDRNVRALFERALSLLPPEKSVEVWNRFVKFEQMYGDLASILKVEQRRKEALSGTSEDGSKALESTLHDVVTRYNFIDLWPCSSKELDRLARQEWLARNIDKKADNFFILNGTNALDKVSGGQADKSNSQPSKVVYPDASRMVVCEPRQTNEQLLPKASNSDVPSTSSIASGNFVTVDEMLKLLSPTLVGFITNLPSIEGPSPSVDVILSILSQCNIPSGASIKASTNQQTAAGPAPSGSDLSGSSKALLHPNGSSRRIPRDGHSAKRKELDRTDDEVKTVQSRQLPRDVFRIRQIQKSRGAAASQTGSLVSGGSAFSGDQSISMD
ncbi:hypothetical protein HPP92_012441 [Vanilla planifolia]|uniref:Suppressor of forked domain-containing protein n=1 Tax=Vanilla planifolia TaxID=51239 RepID=A0A835V1R0_VANPL|nr:hypothetical protein HPP92_012441 [Vanilla planifolia]